MESATFSDDLRRQLKADMITASNDFLTEASMSILRNEASARDVLAWYYREDPIAEHSKKNAIEFYLGAKTDDQAMNYAIEQTTYSRATPELHEKAGHILLNEAVNEHMPLLRSLNGKTLDDPDNKRVIDQLATSISAEQIEMLVVAADSLRIASFSYSLMLADVAGYETVLASVLKAKPIDQELREAQKNMDACKVHSERINDLAEAICMAKAARGDSEARMTALNISIRNGAYFLAEMRENAIGEGPEDRTEAIKEIKTFVYSSWLDAIESAFLLEQNQNPTVRGSAKGDLHEALWLLDVNFLLDAIDDGSTMRGVVPSVRKADRPIINKPMLKRAYDAIATVGGGRTLLCQLKSSTLANNRSSYNPRIFNYTEDNFQDVNKKRLRSRLSAYRHWIESGFDTDAEEPVRKRLLTSSHKFIADVKEVEDMTESEFILSETPSVHLKRQQKRKLERALNKQ